MKNTFLYAGVFLLIALAGCQSKEGASVAYDVNGMGKEKNQIYILDDGLQYVSLNSLTGKERFKGKLSIDGKGVRQLGTGVPEIWFNLRNRTDHALYVESRVTWYDGQGVPVDGPSQWQKVHLPANSSSAVTQSSLSQKAKQYVVELREVQ